MRCYLIVVLICIYLMITPWKESYDQLDRILKSRDITLPTKSVWSRLWFFQWSCMDVRVGL